MNIIESSDVLRPVVKLVCVDSKQIKSIILSSKNIKINEIPCILVIDNNKGTVSKYEGDLIIDEFLQEVERNAIQPTRLFTDLNDIIDYDSGEEIEECQDEEEDVNSTPETIKITSPAQETTPKKDVNKPIAPLKIGTQTKIQITSPVMKANVPSIRS